MSRKKKISLLRKNCNFGQSENISSKHFTAYHISEKSCFLKSMIAKLCKEEDILQENFKLNSNRTSISTIKIVIFELISVYMANRLM